MGANYPGPWGAPSETIDRALRALNEKGVSLLKVSNFYETAAVGRAGQPPYVNAVAQIETAMPPEALLRRLKQIERAAGRRGGSPWGPRSLDIDILDFKGRVQNWQGGTPRFARAGPRPLVLPHPWIEKRPFVLRPLLDVAPDWRHPVTKKSAQELWRRVAQGWEGQVLKVLAPETRLATGA
ncbi:2-amino-4-hydroxy-6-hydroxymethyldihydropteridine diphosphokinase [Methyloceanibacter sp. wino2]|uniref:2-amino-4-hydroxy-6- hydroxymethyldihydropteridine diphosphokinase n=1 Tax=Methyloceanibacter sp. wino2 TaxID=2170729 RepID=UPI00131F03F6|nr:2-amino-4-hydroxy-6-hydroxymethyldihydropteridine diphosphokinase [Methyloceanibacter sp. wino2]